MTVEKITVSVPRDTLARARGAIRRGRVASMSAYVSQAIEQKVKDDELVELLDEMLAESGGPVTRSEERTASRILGIGSRRRHRR